jgi:hypothetical protein
MQNFLHHMYGLIYSGLTLFGTNVSSFDHAGKEPRNLASEAS